MHEHGEADINGVLAEIVALHDRILGDLDPTYVLQTIAPGESLDAGQINRLIVDGEDDLETLTGTDRFHERQWEAADAVVSDMLDSPEDVDRLGDHDLYNCLVDEVMDRDTGDMLATLLNNSDHHPFRYDLHVDLPDYAALADPVTWTDTVHAIAEAAGLDLSNPEVGDALRTLRANAGQGGRLCVLWYGDPGDAWRLVQPAPLSAHIRGAAPAEVIFAGARLLVLDVFHGSGYAVPIDWMTVRRTEHRVALDHGRYSWSDITGGAGDLGGTLIVNPPTIPAESVDWPVCRCGNDPTASGFRWIERTGAEVETKPETHDALLLCPDCGVVFRFDSYDENARTFTVVGHLDRPVSPHADLGV